MSRWTFAIEHVGEDATICGRVAHAKYASWAKGAPTFLNLDQPYPDHVFTAVVWGENRGKFREPPEKLSGQRVCVSGRIESYRKRAQVTVSDPSQIQVERAP